MTFMDKVDSFLIKAEDKFNTLVGKKVVVNCIRLGIDKISGLEEWRVMGKKIYIPADDGDKLKQLEGACGGFITYDKHKLVVC